jgi:hypothetical protein
MMERIRMYRMGDGDALKKIFEEQGLPVDLPLPEKDPSVGVALVLEADGKVEAAILGRVTIEAHLVISPELPGSARKVQRLKDVAEGATLALAERQMMLGLPSVTDIEAVVPVEMTRMQKILHRFGFEPEPSGFVRLWKSLGRTGK